MEGSTNRFVNIWPCEGLGRDAPNAFWCGNNGGVPCNTTSDTGPDNGAMITLGLLHDSFIYKTVATAVPTSGATSTTSIPSGTVTSRETSSTAPVVTDCPADTSSSTPAEEDTGKLVAVGAGVGAPLFIMAMIMGGWAFRERAKRRTMVKQMEEYNAAAAAASAARYAHPDHRRQNYIAELQAEPAEMPATEIDAELDASGRKSIRTSLRTSFRTKR
ncbi:hypothetical protein MW887_001831 [Aspergillus wentii]|nr:hypothetical protein MW887_001831 [Aspergillus wentii]